MDETGRALQSTEVNAPLNDLTGRQIALATAEIQNRSKSKTVAYLLWFFLGGLGIHNFYVGKVGAGIVQLLLFIIGWATVAVGVGIPMLLVLYTWVLIEAFTLGRYIDYKNAMLAETVVASMRR